MNRLTLLASALAVSAVVAAAALAQDSTAVLSDPSWGEETQVLFRSGETSRIVSGELLSLTEDWVQLDGKTGGVWIDRDVVIYLQQAK